MIKCRVPILLSCKSNGKAVKSPGCERWDPEAEKGAKFILPSQAGEHGPGFPSAQYPGFH